MTKAETLFFAILACWSIYQVFEMLKPVKNPDKRYWRDYFIWLAISLPTLGVIAWLIFGGL